MIVIYNLQHKMPLTRKKPIQRRAKLTSSPSLARKKNSGMFKAVRRDGKETANSLMKKCDKLFSIKIRAIGHCEWCGVTTNLQCSHVLPRTIKPLRCDPLNAICLCYHCHLGVWHKNPLFAHQWFESAFPGRFEKLQAISNARLGLKVDWQAIYDELKAGG